MDDIMYDLSAVYAALRGHAKRDMRELAARIEKVVTDEGLSLAETAPFDGDVEAEYTALIAEMISSTDATVRNLAGLLHAIELPYGFNDSDEDVDDIVERAPVVPPQQIVPVEPVAPYVPAPPADYDDLVEDDLDLYQDEIVAQAPVLDQLRVTLSSAESTPRALDPADLDVALQLVLTSLTPFGEFVLAGSEVDASDPSRVTFICDIVNAVDDVDAMFDDEQGALNAPLQMLTVPGFYQGELPFPGIGWIHAEAIAVDSHAPSEIVVRVSRAMMPGMGAAPAGFNAAETDLVRELVVRNLGTKARFGDLLELAVSDIDGGVEFMFSITTPGDMRTDQFAYNGLAWGSYPGMAGMMVPGLGPVMFEMVIPQVIEA